MSPYDVNVVLSDGVLNGFVVAAAAVDVRSGSIQYTIQASYTTFEQ